MRRRIITQDELDRPKVRRVMVILVAGTIAAGAAAWLAGVDVRDEDRHASRVAARPLDPLRAELLRCNGLGQAALDDPGCRAAWAENRRRFFGSANRQPPSVNKSRAVPVGSAGSSSSETTR